MSRPTSAWLLAGLLACTPSTGSDTAGPSDATGTTNTAETTDATDATDTATAPPPSLSAPALAEDLDPAADVLHVALTAAPHTWAAGDQLVEGFAYNGQVPGPTLRLKVGDQLVVDLQNDTGLDTSIHWHGLSVPYAMDGAGWQISPVPPGGAFRYTFTVAQPGTFWYHPHFDTERAVDLGLYGVVVVEDPADPPVDEELVVVLDSIGEADADVADQGIEPSPLRWLANGQIEPAWSVAAGTRARVRLVNVSNVGYVALDDVLVVAGDQGRLPEVRSSVVLPPGDRADLLWPVGPGSAHIAAYPFSMAGPGSGPPQRLFSVESTGSGTASSDWPSAPAAPTPDPGRTDLRYTFTGQPGEGWEINGQTFPDIEPDEVALGAEVVLEIRNASPVHHPFHLHGMPFEVLSIDGEAPSVRQLEDTLDIGIRQTARLLIRADNAGDWMSHCHILPHAEQGMMTVLRVHDPDE